MNHCFRDYYPIELKRTIMASGKAWLRGELTIERRRLEEAQDHDISRHKILVTGADGLPVLYLVEHTACCGLRRRCFVLYSFGSRGWLTHAGAAQNLDVFAGDMCPHGVWAAMKGCSVVLLSPPLAIPYSYHSPDTYGHQHQGTLNVVQAARPDVARVVTSTSEVHGTALPSARIIPQPSRLTPPRRSGRMRLRCPIMRRSARPSRCCGPSTPMGPGNRRAPSFPPSLARSMP
jgi:nucleoside-diphosphate-sugar epimerase